ncbi:hypothetical protein ACUIJ5_29600 (plasmid) [Bacillus toyonensis]
MFKKLVVGALTTGVLLTGGITASASEISVKEKIKRLMLNLVERFIIMSIIVKMSIFQITLQEK